MSAKEDLLDQLDLTRERLLVAIEPLPDEALMQPGVVGRWSVADLLSILTAWEAELVTGLMQLKQGRTPARLLAALDQPDQYNARNFQDSQGRDLDLIFDDFQGSRLHLEDWLEAFNEKALTAPGHYKALGGRSLQDVIAAATYQHEARYLPFLETFAQRWEVTAATAASNGRPETTNDHD